ncbi:MAG TPA: hypothetical protein VJR05_13165 [Acidimicrobiia bacterium]|nr:hypothetical protein [Acidimicrobiia bacterium]
MADPPLLGPTPARQLGLPDPDDKVAVFLVPDAVPTGDLVVDLPSLAELMAYLPDTVELVVIAAGDHLDSATRSQVEAMLVLIRDEDALAGYRPVSEALKEVEEGLVVRGVDRSGLVMACGPEVIRRSSLHQALARAVGTQRASLTGLIAATNGRVGLVEASQAEGSAAGAAAGLQRPYGEGGSHPGSNRRP